MLKKVLGVLTAAIFILTITACQMPSQADHIKKKGGTNVSILTFDVSYDSNGGSGSMPVKDYKIGEEVTVLPVSFTAPVGLKFNRWNTKEDGTGSTYNPGEKFLIDSSEVTLYAIWIDKDAHSINYYNTYGVSNPNPYSYLESKTVTIQPISRDYYTFEGWYRNSSFTGSEITGWTPGTYSSNIRLYAKWTPIRYNITYNIDGGTIPSGQYNPSYFTVETNHTLVSPQKNGYNFDGWYDNEGNKITVLNSALAGQELVLTARYSLAHYEITYHLYHGTNAQENPETYTILDEISLGEPTKQDRTFMGWFTTSNRKGTPITKIEKGTFGPLHLYAKWDIDVFDVGDDGIGNITSWLNEVLDTTSTDNVIAISGNATTNELKTLSSAITAKSQYIEELDLSELNVTQFYNSGNGWSGSGFLQKLKNVKTIKLPDTLEVISEGAFAYCTNLEHVILNNGLTDILWSAFGHCEKLKEITIPDSVEFLAQTSFAYCISLEKVNISKNSNLLIIGCRAFWGCTSLQGFYVPPKVTYLDNRTARTARENHDNYGNIAPSTSGAFDGCTTLSTLKFSKELTRIHQGTFTGCTNISEVYYEGTEAEWRAINIGTNNGRLSNWESAVATGTLTMHFEAEYPLYP